MSKDIRVLCKACADRYREIGYRLRRIKDFKEECFICNKRGYEYEVCEGQAKNKSLKIH